MFDDLKTLFFQNVVAAHDSYMRQRDSEWSGQNKLVRRALDAATALFHFREHVPKPLQKSRAQVVRECPDYRFLGDVVNASKHHVLDRPTSEGPPLVRTAEDIEECTVVTQFHDDDGPYSDARTIVMVNCTDGVRRDLDSALTRVLNYWGLQLQEAEILESYIAQPSPDLPGTRLLARADARPPNLEVSAGLRFKKTFKLLKFDPASASSSAVDLSTAAVSFKVFKLAYSLDFSVTSPNGDTATCSIDLTEAESIAFHGLPEAEKPKFAMAVGRTRRSEIEQMLSAALAGRIAKV